MIKILNRIFTRTVSYGDLESGVFVAELRPRWLEKLNARRARRSSWGEGWTDIGYTEDPEEQK